MKRLSQYFLRGLLTFLPIGLTVYLLYVFLAGSERLLAAWLMPVLDGFYVPGMGLLVGVLGILLLGLVVSQSLLSKVVDLLELPFNNLPIVKSVYSSLKSFTDYFSPSEGDNAQQVVVLRMPDQGLGQSLEIVGFLTRNQLDDLPDGVSKDDRVAVYLPMSYMVGGYTVFVPRSWITPLDLSVEEAMRSSLIAWMGPRR